MANKLDCYFHLKTRRMDVNVTGDEKPSTNTIVIIFALDYFHSRISKS